MKPFKTIDEQIEILKSRNLKFKDIEKAKTLLLYNNYYNLINNFSKFLITNNKYNDDIYFENILSIEEFDKELKTLLFKYMLEIEKQFKSVVIYNYCEHFKNNNYAYMNIENYNKNKIIDAGLLISEFAKIIGIQVDKKNKNNNSIKHYYQKYNNVPLWVISNYLTLGQFIKFYKLIDDKIKNRIAFNLNKLLSDNLNIDTKLTMELVESFLDNIREVRNTVAHNNRIIYFRCKKNIKYSEFLHSGDSNTQRQDLYNVIITFKCFLDRNQYTQFYNSLLKIISNFKMDIQNENYYKKVLNSLGIPENLEQI